MKLLFIMAWWGWSKDWYLPQGWTLRFDQGPGVVLLLYSPGMAAGGLALYSLVHQEFPALWLEDGLLLALGVEVEVLYMDSLYMIHFTLSTTINLCLCHNLFDWLGESIWWNTKLYVLVERNISFVHFHVSRINLPLMMVFVANCPPLPLALAPGSQLCAYCTNSTQCTIFTHFTNSTHGTHTLHCTVHTAHMKCLFGEA